MTTDRRWDVATYHAELGQWIEAAQVLVDLVDEELDASAARLLLARAYFHSAQLGRAEEQARALVEANPADGYAQLLLGRALSRQSRHDEAAAPLKLAAALGVS
ncbi:tetratricopeptide repeat protein [Actinomycetospora endophytica]|uniref:Tetratricopeptide repeat protein n=1 Tax=Actinomycetospora endophytica TaxID=2291215 RepID=A0ABS8PDB3_9PSEU|nr:tetratricopeptide repeat protein [Actinomycetospora endophytica]MCD2195455.1 tetratricopeptide repeat protein [Actinomycetospora endophytica]